MPSSQTYYRSGDHVKIIYSRLAGKYGTIVGPSKELVYSVELDGSLERHDVHVSKMIPAPKIIVRLEGEKISPVDVMVGDTIRVVNKANYYGQTDSNEGVITAVKFSDDGNASLYTTGVYDGCIYSPSWHTVGHLILVKKAKEKHPLEDAEAGTAFTYDSMGRKYINTKLREDWWAVEVTTLLGQELLRVFRIREHEAQSAFTNNNGKMVK